jgi:uncharacterized membrane protein
MVEGFWQWVEQVPPVLGIVLLTLFPALELRASIPYGLLATETPVWTVVGLAVAVNWALAPLLYLFLKYVLHLLLRWRWFARHWERYAERVQARIHRQVETWGALGLALFIGIPLPGSGVYTGAVGAYLLGMGFRRFLWVALVGVCIAAILVTAVVLTGSEAFKWMVTLEPQG